MTIQCCVCRRFRVKQSWKKMAVVDGRISYSYCPTCREKAKDELKSGSAPLATR